MRFSRSHLMLVLILTGPFCVGALSAQTTVAPVTQEYFVQQKADEALLIKVNSFEAEFESTLTAQDGEVLLVSGIPGNRIAPVFQYVTPPKTSRQLEIQVSSQLHSGRSQFGIELVRMSVWDNRSEAVARAYRQLSFGLQASKSKNRADWTVRIDNLVNAGKLFQRFGMQEMRLWSNYLAAYLIQYHLHDYSIVYTMTREILADLKGSRMQKIELAALQLQGAALIGLKRSGSLDVPVGSPDPVQTVLSSVAAMAESMGFGFEQAYALKLSGAEYMSQAWYPRALEQFQQAVEIADEVGDVDLAKEIRESMVDIHAIQGDAPASGKVLKEIETQLLDSGSGDELALNLLAQGRLLIRAYRYPQAVDVLSEALNHENNSAIRRQINFELAKVFYQTGRLDESIDYLQLAGINPGASQLQRTNSVLDIGEGLRIMANIHRTRNEFDEMRKTRSAQGHYKPPAAAYSYQRGLDELALPAGNKRLAQSFFTQSHQAAIETGQLEWQHLSRLQLCALGSTRAAGLSLCSDKAINDSYQWLINGGIPSFAIEAMNLHAWIRAAGGQHKQAVATLDRLLDEIHFLQSEIPGVLGAWYRERHESLFNRYLELLTRSSGQKGRGDGSASLLALSKIRHIEKLTGHDQARDAVTGDSELLRTQLAQRANASHGTDQSALNGEINRELTRRRSRFRKAFAYLSESGLQEYLHDLARDERLVTFHISPTSARVWVGQRSKIQTQALPNPAYIYSALQEARHGLADIGQSSFDSKMDALGKRLLGPVADLLAETMYWIPAGPLLGFPMDALRLKGRYLFERHQVAGLMSFPSNSGPANSLQAKSLSSVFLAGNPQDYSSLYANRLETSVEISAIADIFVGPGLRIVQGVALLPDEFEVEQFLDADLVHLSMPGEIDLGYPDQSSLELSGREDTPGRASYMPADIRSHPVHANLVFLSATQLKNQPVSAFSHQTGLISDFVDAGADSLVASLWANDGPATEEFLSGFYRDLAGSGDIAGSLHEAKRRYLRDNRDNGLYDWAAYQLFIK